MSAKLVSIATLPGLPLRLYAVDNIGRLWLGTYLTPSSHLHWEEVRGPFSYAETARAPEGGGT